MVFQTDADLKKKISDKCKEQITWIQSQCMKIINQDKLSNTCLKLFFGSRYSLHSFCKRCICKKCNFKENKTRFCGNC